MRKYKEPVWYWKDQEGSVESRGAANFVANVFRRLDGYQKEKISQEINFDQRHACILWL